MRVLNVTYGGKGVWASSVAMAESIERYSDHDCYYFDATRGRLPLWVRVLRPDLVVFHHVVMGRRTKADLAHLRKHLTRLAKTAAVRAAVVSDETWASDRLLSLIAELGVQHVFSFASPEAREVIYRGLPDSVQFHTVLNGYIDEAVVERVSGWGITERPVDVGFRGSNAPICGDWGEMKSRLVAAFQGPLESAGMSSDMVNGFVGVGDDWLKFLSRCRYQLGLEAGSSMLDRTGEVLDYLVERGWGTATLNDVHREFPDLEGNIKYRALAPRHLEAVVTRCCQVLVEGEYSGVLVPELHYIPVKPDLSNVDEVVARLKDEDARLAMVERAYADIVGSGAYSYSAFAQTLLSAVGDDAVAPHRTAGPVVALLQSWDRMLQACMNRPPRRQLLWPNRLKVTFRRVLGRLLGEQLIRSILDRIRSGAG